MDAVLEDPTFAQNLSSGSVSGRTRHVFLLLVWPLALVIAAAGCGQGTLVDAGFEGTGTSSSGELATTTTVAGGANDQVVPEVEMYAEQQGISYDEALVELDVQGSLLMWADSVRLEPWFDGFQFERTNQGTFGVVALNPDLGHPDLPGDLPLRSVISRMGQQRWRDLVPTLADDMEAMGIVGLSYDPFGDTVTVARREDLAPGANDAQVADRVRALLGDSFTGVEVMFDTGEGTNFESPPTTR